MLVIGAVRENLVYHHFSYLASHTGICLKYRGVASAGSTKGSVMISARASATCKRGLIRIECNAVYVSQETVHPTFI